MQLAVSFPDPVGESGNETESSVTGQFSNSPHLEYKDLCPVAYADEAVGQHTQTGVIAEHCTEPLLHGEREVVLVYG